MSNTQQDALNYRPNVAIWQTNGRTNSQLFKLQKLNCESYHLKPIMAKQTLSLWARKKIHSQLGRGKNISGGKKNNTQALIWIEVSQHDIMFHRRGDIWGDLEGEPRCRFTADELTGEMFYQNRTSIPVSPNKDEWHHDLLFPKRGCVTPCGHLYLMTKMNFLLIPFGLSMMRFFTLALWSKIKKTQNK